MSFSQYVREELLELVKEIAISEGLYVWKPTF